jgi:L-ascorbate metabolism protein UlaG (beta-lactamase superfamily)
MKTKFITLTILLLLSTATFVWSQKTTETCTVTYIANDGVLIETRNHKVLIDALFGNIKGDWCDQPGDSVSNLMVKGMPPFENIDIVLVTHNHIDHFNGQITINFLKDNQNSFLICPDQVNESLKHNADYPKVSDRINFLKPGKLFDTSLCINEINIRTLRFRHNAYYETDSVSGKSNNIHRDVENLAYLIKTDGFTIFHSGDDTPSNQDQYKFYKFRKENIDIAFLDRKYTQADGWNLLDKYIHTKNLIYMHIQTHSDEFFKSITNLPGDVPQRFVFSEPMQIKVFSKKR